MSYAAARRQLVDGHLTECAVHGVALVVPMRHGRSDAVHGASSQLLRIRKSSLTRRTARRSNESSSIDGHEKCAHSVRCAHRWERLGATTLPKRNGRAAATTPRTRRWHEGGLPRQARRALREASALDYLKPRTHEDYTRDVEPLKVYFGRLSLRERRTQACGRVPRPPRGKRSAHARQSREGVPVDVLHIAHSNWEGKRQVEPAPWSQTEQGDQARTERQARGISRRMGNPCVSGSRTSRLDISNSITAKAIIHWAVEHRPKARIRQICAMRDSQ